MRITIEYDDGRKASFDNVIDYTLYDRDDVLQNLYGTVDLDTFLKDTDKVDELCEAVREKANECDCLPPPEVFSGIVMECAENLGIVKGAE